MQNNAKGTIWFITFTGEWKCEGFLLFLPIRSTFVNQISSFRIDKKMNVITGKGAVGLSENHAPISDSQ